MSELVKTPRRPPASECASASDKYFRRPIASPSPGGSNERGECLFVCCSGVGRDEGELNSPLLSVILLTIFSTSRVQPRSGTSLRFLARRNTLRTCSGGVIITHSVSLLTEGLMV